MNRTCTTFRDRSACLLLLNFVLASVACFQSVEEEIATPSAGDTIFVNDQYGDVIIESVGSAGVKIHAKDETFQCDIDREIAKSWNAVRAAVSPSSVALTKRWQIDPNQLVSGAIVAISTRTATDLVETRYVVEVSHLIAAADAIDAIYAHCDFDSNVKILIDVN